MSKTSDLTFVNQISQHYIDDVMLVYITQLTSHIEENPFFDYPELVYSVTKKLKVWLKIWLNIISTKHYKQSNYMQYDNYIFANMKLKINI